MSADRSARQRPAGLIAGILPPMVAAAESMAEAPEAGGELFPAEQALLRTAGPRRRADFTAGRLCARAALDRLGVPATPILPGTAGEPQWPAGVTGSITHCTGYRACAVALARDVTGIGIDAEPDLVLPAGLIEAVATSPEQAWLRQLAAAVPAVCWDRLLFSAKEAACKLWYPLTGEWLGLQDVVIRPDAAGTFAVRLPGRGPVPDAGRPTRMTGRWLARDGLILTAITWPP
jgi:4'-phosphopantetheinyl transferase EntD